MHYAVELASIYIQKTNQVKFPHIERVARSVLGIMPSPVIAERMFSRATFLTEKRRNRLSMPNLRLRLIFLGSENEKFIFF